MKTKLLLLSSLLLLVGNCFGQVMFQKVIHARYACQANAIQQTIDSGYIIAGTITDSTDLYNELYIIKTNKYGDTIWTKTFGGTPDYDNEGLSVILTTDSGYIVAGTITDTSGSENIYLIKINTSGDTLWTKAYGGDGGQNGYCVKQTNDRGYIITGRTFSFGAGSYDVYLLKLNDSGTLIWTKTYGGSGNDYGSYVEQTSDSGYIICGGTESFGVNSVYLIKTNSSGDTLWTKTYGGTNLDYGNAVHQTNDGGYIIAGYTTSFGISYGNAYVIKTKANGDTSWTKIYTADGGSSAGDVQPTNDGGYIITGYADREGISTYTYLIKTNSNGDTLWTKVYGGISYDGGSSVSQTYDGGYIISGSSNPSHSIIPPMFYINLIKTDGDGNTGCNQSNTTTIVSSTATIVGNPHTMVSSGGTESPTAALIGSGGNDSTICLYTGINEQSINNSVSIYPNPAENQFTVYGLRFTVGRLEIYNVLGQVCSQSEIVNLKSEIVVDVPSLPSGLYFVRVSGENESWAGKFIKE